MSSNNGLIFYYGPYNHPQGEVYPQAIEYIPQFSEKGIRWGTKYRFKVAGSYVNQSPELDHDGVDARSVAIDAAYLDDYKDCGFKFSDGTPTIHKMTSNDPFNMSGNKILYRSWDNNGPTEMANTRSFSITIESLFKQSYNEILYFSEFVQRMGTGGEVWNVDNVWEGAPVRTKMNNLSKVYHVQRGMIIGLSDWPTPPPPLWPLEEQGWKRTLAQHSPIQHGDLTFNRSKMSHFRVDYTYYFERLGYDPTTEANTWFNG